MFTHTTSDGVHSCNWCGTGAASVYDILLPASDTMSDGGGIVELLGNVGVSAIAFARLTRVPHAFDSGTTFAIDAPPRV